jgi:hypothetical protein
MFAAGCSTKHSKQTSTDVEELKLLNELLVDSRWNWCPARITCWSRIASQVELELPLHSFINNVSHPEDIFLCCIDSMNVFQCSADPISRVTYWLYWLSYPSIRRNSLTNDRNKHTPSLSILYMREIRNTLCGVTNTQKSTSESPHFEIFPLNPTSHTPQFYVSGILISRDHVHVKWIKLVGGCSPPLFL